MNMQISAGRKYTTTLIREDVRILKLVRARRAERELSILNELALSIGGAGSLQEILQLVIRSATRATGAEQGVITLLNPGNNSLQTLVRTRSLSASKWLFRPGACLIGWMQAHQQPLVVNDPLHDPRFEGATWDPAVHSVLSVPLLDRGRLLGQITVFNRISGDGFDAEDVRLMTIIAAQAAQVIENARLAQDKARLIALLVRHCPPGTIEKLIVC